MIIYENELIKVKEKNNKYYATFKNKPKVIALGNTIQEVDKLIELLLKSNDNG